METEGERATLATSPPTINNRKKYGAKKGSHPQSVPKDKATRYQPMSALKAKGSYFNSNKRQPQGKKAHFYPEA